MTMNKHVCNYAVVKFLPYPETGEFVCVGVALFCRDPQFFDFKLEMKKRERITGFFPELDAAVFIQGRRIFEQQLQHVRGILKPPVLGEQLRLNFGNVDPVGIFKELVRPRESLFRFSGISTVLTEEPARELERLYENYVERQFAQGVEYQEGIMARRLQNLFREREVTGYRNEFLGDEDYRFRIPFVRGEIGRIRELKIIKPLNLNQGDTTRLIDHGDLWMKRVGRLMEMNADPARLLLPVKMPAGDKRVGVARDIRAKFKRIGVDTLEFANHRKILEFAAAE